MRIIFINDITKNVRVELDDGTLKWWDELTRDQKKEFSELWDAQKKHAAQHGVQLTEIEILGNDLEIRS